MYLIPADYKRLIQTDNLTQLIAGDNAILSASELAAQTELVSYLVQKYETAKEFTDTNQWNKASVYKASNRVYITASAYDPAATYTTGAYVLQAGNIYRSIAGNPPGAFNASEWTLIAANNQLYYAQYPKPDFNVYSPYKVGDQVYYKDKVYTCLIASSFPTFPPNIQVPYYELTPLPNVFPDDQQQGVIYWGVGVAYQVPANTEIDNTTYWTKGDSRNQQLVGFMVDICLYHVHSRIAPRNIPDLRVKRYDDAINWLRRAAKGEDITADIPKKQPRQGGRIRWGGQTKNQNSY